MASYKYKSLFILLSAVMTASAQQYKLVKSYDRSTNFFDFFEVRDRTFFNNLGYGTGDPTSGFVDYATRQEALNSGLMAYRGNQMYIGVDSTNKVPVNGKGRKSVRLESRETFSGGLLLADIAHMPGNACGVWPALWAYNMNEDPISEIDFLEGNGWTGQAENTVSLHTCGRCTFPNLKGPELRRDCELKGCEGTPSNPAGCGVNGAKGSFGTEFNNGGGGIYALLLDTTGIRVWFLPRNKITSDITSGRPNPSLWGTPQADFRSSSSCNVGKTFKDLTIIINTSFCGAIMYDYKAQMEGYPQCGSASGGSCNAYVGANPQAYKEAYWLFNSIKMYK